MARFLRKGVVVYDISSMADPATEPDKVIMDGGSVSMNQTVTLLVASTKELFDSTGATTNRSDYKSNSGNKYWEYGLRHCPSLLLITVTIIDDETINLQAGQSEEIGYRVSKKWKP